MIESKICKTCKEEKNINLFNKQKSNKDGFKVICKDCQCSQRKEYTEKLKKSGEYFWIKRTQAVNDFRTRAKNVIDLKSIPIDKDALINLFNSQNRKCSYCYCDLTEINLVFDHSIPLSRGGIHEINNLSATCIDCNNLKFKRTKEEFKEFLNVYIKRFMIL